MENQPIGSDDVRNKMKEHSNRMHHKIDAESLRQMLREKCRVRMREARQLRFDKCRDARIEGVEMPYSLDKAFLTDTILAELRELNENLQLEQEIMDEIFAESFEWALKELESELSYYSRIDEIGTFVVCPVCLMGELAFDDNNQSKCTCGIQFYYEGDRFEFHALMDKILSMHQAVCPSDLTFYVEPIESGHTVLCAVCKDCDFCHQV